MSLAYLNGAIVRDEEARVSIFDRGFLYGDGVFETMRTYDGQVFKLPEHLERLERSAAEIRLKLPLDRDELAAAVDDTLAANRLDQEALIRLTVSRGVGGEGLFPVADVRPTVVIAVRPLEPYPAETYEKGWKLIIAHTRRNDPSALKPAVKSQNFLNNVMARAEAVAAGADEALMLNHGGLVAEGTVSNVFVVLDGELVTPPERDGLLPGITRQVTLGLARAHRIPVDERSLVPDDVYASAEAFVTLTSAGVVPVTSVGGRPIGGGRPGPITQRLIKLFNEYAMQEPKARA